jgi:hypothetical protein
MRPLHDASTSNNESWYYRRRRTVSNDNNNRRNMNLVFQLISNATGTSLLTIDQSKWVLDTTTVQKTNHTINNSVKNHEDGQSNHYYYHHHHPADKAITVSTLTLFPKLLQPTDESTMNELLLTNTHQHSITLHHHVHDSNSNSEKSRMAMLPCQQLVLPGGKIATIVGCWTRQDTWIEFRFWRIRLDRNHDTTTQESSPHSRNISVEKYGFCRIEDTFTTCIFSEYDFSSVNNAFSSSHDFNHSSETERPRLYMTAKHETNYFVHEFRIHQWADDCHTNDELALQMHDEHNGYTPIIHTAECTYEIPVISTMSQGPHAAFTPRISGIASLSDGSTILLVHLEHEIQVWNMTTTDVRSTPDITHIPVTERLCDLIGTHFSSDSLLHRLFIGDNFLATNIIYAPPLVGTRRLQIDRYGFFTFTVHTLPIPNCLQTFWELDDVTMSWQISSLIMVPVCNAFRERDMMATPQYHYDGQKLIVLGCDNFGYVLLIYEILTKIDEKSDFAWRQRCQGRYEQSGGVYNFSNITMDDVDGNNQTFSSSSSSSSPNQKRRQRRQIQFRRRIRHEAFGIRRRGTGASMQLSCNERFILVRIRDETNGPDRIIYFDLNGIEIDIKNEEHDHVLREKN